MFTLSVARHEYRQARSHATENFVYIYLLYIKTVLYTAVWLHECIRILQVHGREVIALYFAVKFQNFHMSLSWEKFKITFFPPSRVIKLSLM